MTERAQVDSWQLQDSSAEAYERYLVPLLFAPAAEHLVGLAAVKPGERLLDVACGTGIVARCVASHVNALGMVVGLDLNVSMLAVARRASSEIQPQIQWRQGSASDMPFADGSFDVICCQQGLQFFDDQPRALHEMYRVLVPNGRLVLSVLRSLKHNAGWVPLAEALERHVGPDAGAMMRSPFPEWSTDELRGMVTRAGFADVLVLVGIGPVRYPSADEFLRLEAVSSPLAGPIGSLKTAVREAIIRDLHEALSENMDDDGIVFPAETYLVCARRAEPGSESEEQA